MTGVDDDEKKPEKDSPQESGVIAAFREYSKELDFKHDKYERIVKLSRDITIASKRIIFSTHGLLRSKKLDEDMKKVSYSLEGIRDTQFKAISKELVGQDPYQFIRAYIWGIQEFVEALTFFSFVKDGTFYNYQEVIAYLGESGPLLIPLVDYILGVEDLTGELMRHCIDSFTLGKTSSAVLARDMSRAIYAGLLGMNRLPVCWSDFQNKVKVARQSLEKMEFAAYSYHLRSMQQEPSPPILAS